MCLPMLCPTISWCSLVVCKRCSGVSGVVAKRDSNGAFIEYSVRVGRSSLLLGPADRGFSAVL